jgi:TatA/E family protein of Tat protein translocase
VFGLGFGELIVVGIIALIFIGPKKLPELAKGLGQGIREFQNAAKGFTDNLKEETQELPKKATEVTPEIVDASQHKAPETVETVIIKKEDTHS